MVPDPYKALGLPHNATQSQIKSSYRKLALRYHPDRHVSSSKDEKTQAADRFATISAAYNILSDEEKKRTYDHIYKYGGFDDEKDTATPQQRRKSESSVPPHPGVYNVRSSFGGKGSTGGGYRRNNSAPPAPSPTDPIFFRFNRPGGIGFPAYHPLSGLLFRPTGGAGVEVNRPNPPRGRPPRSSSSSSRRSSGAFRRDASGGSNSTGFSFAFSTTQNTTTPSGAKQRVHKTTQFINGTKRVRVETTTVHPDGRKEVKLEVDGCDVHSRMSGGASGVSSRKKSPPTGEEQHPECCENSPWYANVWNSMQHKLSMCHSSMTMCHSPCGQILVQP